MKRIINLCPTGMMPTKALTPHVPITPDEIVQTSIECAKLGVSIVHIHPRDTTGKPTWDPELFKRIIGGIRNKIPDLVISATTSGRLWSEFDKRSAVLDLTDDYKPDLASLTVGSQNFIRTPSINSPQMISDLASKMLDRGIKPELEVFEPGMLHKANYLLKKGVVESPPYFNILLGSLGTSPLHPATFAAFHSLLPDTAIWSLAGIGKYQLEANITALAFGGHIRVGLEDNIFFDRNKKILATNQSLVNRIVSIIQLTDSEPTTPSETRRLLQI